MKFSAAIFDMDGLLIDSEPLWQEAGTAMLSQYGITLTDAQYHKTTGLRTPEWIDHWFSQYKIDKKHIPEAINYIVDAALEKISTRGVVMPGVEYIMQFFKDHRFKIGLASSSPMRLIEVVVEKINIRQYLDVMTSAEHLSYGKPHPQVFLDCAGLLSQFPTSCICFEDSFNGMIAAKAARMACVVVPAPQQHDETRWDAADYKLSSLQLFNRQVLDSL